jgi:hypothetical protein
MARTSLHGARVGSGGTVGMGREWSGRETTATATATARAGFGCGLGVEGVGGGCGWVGRLDGWRLCRD